MNNRNCQEQISIPNFEYENSGPENKFKQFSAERQSKYAHFWKLAPEPQTKLLELLEYDLNEHYRQKMLGPKMRHCSTKTKDFCLEWFHHEQNIALKEEAVAEYDARISVEEELTYVFESFEDHLQKKYRHFYESRFDEKEMILQKMLNDKITEQSEQKKRVELINTQNQQINFYLSKDSITKEQAKELYKTVLEQTITNSHFEKLLQTMMTKNKAQQDKSSQKEVVNQTAGTKKLTQATQLQPTANTIETAVQTEQDTETFSSQTEQLNYQKEVLKLQNKIEKCNFNQPANDNQTNHEQNIPAREIDVSLDQTDQQYTVRSLLESDYQTISRVKIDDHQGHLLNSQIIKNRTEQREKKLSVSLFKQVLQKLKPVNQNGIKTGQIKKIVERSVRKRTKV
jgi:hypothetical protein